MAQEEFDIDDVPTDLDEELAQIRQTNDQNAVEDGLKTLGDSGDTFFHIAETDIRTRDLETFYQRLNRGKDEIWEVYF